jgi:hypothetical protein
MLRRASRRSTGRAQSKAARAVACGPVATASHCPHAATVLMLVAFEDLPSINATSAFGY